MNPLAFSWNASSAGGTLSGSGSMSISGFNSTQLTIAVTLTDASDPLLALTLLSFGFGITPNVSGVSFSDLDDGGISDASLAALPGTAATEVCASTGPGCFGSPASGLRDSSDSFELRLFGIWGSSVDIEPLALRYFTALGDVTLTSGSGGTVPGQITLGAGGTHPVPAPGSAGLAALGLASLVALAGMRRRLRPIP